MLKAQFLIVNAERIVLPYFYLLHIMINNSVSRIHPLVIIIATLVWHRRTHIQGRLLTKPEFLRPFGRVTQLISVEKF